MIFYIITFYTLSPAGVRIIVLSATEFLTGALIPLPFLPDKIQTVFNLLPFASMQNLPLRIYSGDIAGTEMLFSFIIQLFWVVTFLITGNLWLKQVIKKVIVQGG